MSTTYPPLTAYRVHLSDGSSYVTSMAAGVTLAEARGYFVGSVQYLDLAETQKVTVIDVTDAKEDDEKAQALGFRDAEHAREHEEKSWATSGEVFRAAYLDRMEARR